METPTPETDAARATVTIHEGEYLIDLDHKGRWVEATLAEKLERERDEAMRLLSAMERKT